jgi:ketosteroid isomerase-like protein
VRNEGLALRHVFADDAIWTVPGEGLMAGVYRGREQIFRFLAQLPKETGGTYSSRLVDVLASDERAAALYRASGTRRGRRLDLDQVLLFRIEDGLVREVLALPSDPAAFETFWEV